MEKNAQNTKEKVEAAFQLLSEETTTFEKFEKIRILIKGINPSLDKKLDSASDAVNKLQKLQKGEVIELSAEILPEDTEEDKKRKKAILFFISKWKELRSEVKRINDLYQQAGSDGKITAEEHANILGKTFSLAKGPLGIITIGALLVVGAIKFLESSAVSITIKNQGCVSLTPIARLPVPIPGIKLPEETIPDGGEGIAVVPPLDVNVNGTQPGSVTLSALGFSMGYYLPGPNVDVIFNNQSLIGKRTLVKLSDSKQHTLIVNCPSSL
ncbi:hypothetical protein HYW54_02860 [Candidatus Gottesmanbacteria bacterium]|nr:hypothetical protein [Candidatus Gottesmanbacteria bacterium]MBI3955126.1 hypothetical protein [Candidatus Gottesmanbacteria bacterium]